MIIFNECIAVVNSVLPDPTMTVDNVSQILNKIQWDKWQRVMDGLGIPGSLLGRSEGVTPLIQRRTMHVRTTISTTILMLHGKVLL